MEWYWELPDTVQRENAGVYDHLSKMKGGLEAQLIGLYKLLLLYQMKSVCSYYKNRGLVFLRDIAKLDDWDGDIKAVEKAEAIFNKDSDFHLKEKINANLEQVVTFVKQKMTKEDSQCFKDLGITDPTYDKKRIESTKGGLLEQSYCWVLDNPDFQQWRDEEERQLLWIRGDPGKGKTMLLCGIANELRNTSSSSDLISHFFCQATDQRINNANAVLWGLMYMLVDQQPALMHHIRSKYDASGKALFLGQNSWIALSEIFSDMLKDPALTRAYLLIDALDECTSDRDRLLDLVVKNLSTASHVKWILSSRNWPEIERQLAESQSLEKISLSLEVNTDLVSCAVDAYIEHEISHLRLIKDHPTLKDQMQQQMRQKANGTFLWVALVVKDLRDRQDAEYEDPLYILNVLMEMPDDLTSLYSLMVDHIVKLKGDAPNLCKKVLSAAALASRPLSLVELRILAGFDNSRINDQVLERVVNKCGSFLTIRDCTVYFVHQSAKDHLILHEPTQPVIFSSGHGEVHYTIFSHSLRAMTSILKKNIYTLSHPALHIDEIEAPGSDPLAAIRYSCAHWIDHLCSGISDNGSLTHQDRLDDTGTVFVFLRKHFLHWLEALSLLRNISDNVLSIKKLEVLLTVSLQLSTLVFFRNLPFQTHFPQTQLVRFLRDGHRFILYFIKAIEITPLQVYSSALIFCPMQSPVRQTFDKSLPSWILNKPIMNEIWSPCLQILESRESHITAMAFSGDNKLATTSLNGITIWDITTGARLRKFSDSYSVVFSLYFTKNGWLVSGSLDGAIRVWNLATGTCIQKLKRYTGPVTSISALTDNKLALASDDRTIEIWDIATGACVQTLKTHGSPVKYVIALTDHTLASRSKDTARGTAIRIWDITMGICVQTLESHSSSVTSMGVLTNNKLASGLYNGTIEIWDIAAGVCIQKLMRHSCSVTSITAFTDNKLASASKNGTIRIWDIATGACIQTLKAHGDPVTFIIALTDYKLASVASGLEDATIRIWDTAIDISNRILDGHSEGINSVAFSADGKQMASGSTDNTVKIWNTATEMCIHTLEGHSAYIISVAFSKDGRQVASGSYDKAVKIWDTATGVCAQTLKDHNGYITSVAFSEDGRRVASGSSRRELKIWDTATGACVHTIEDYNGWMKSIALSKDGGRVASESSDKAIKIWNTATGACVQTLKGHSGGITSVAFLKDGRRLASGSSDETVKIWDTATGVCVQTLPLGVVTQLSFNDEAAHHLQTNFGILVLDPELVTNEATSEVSVPLTGYGINKAGSWITKNGKPLLRLPLDYRPEASAISGSMVGIGTKSGRVLMFQFSKLDGFSV
jgi:WD40 repeat protein